LSKDIKNIDELFQSTLGNHKVTAPAHVKRNVLAKTSRRYLGYISAALVAASIVSLVIWQYSSPEVKSDDIAHEASQVENPTHLNEVISEEKRSHIKKADNHIESDSPEHKIFNELKDQSAHENNSVQKHINPSSDNNKDKPTTITIDKNKITPTKTFVKKDDNKTNPSGQTLEENNSTDSNTSEASRKPSQDLIIIEENVKESTTASQQNNESTHVADHIKLNDESVEITEAKNEDRKNPKETELNESTDLTKNSFEDTTLTDNPPLKSDSTPINIDTIPDDFTEVIDTSDTTKEIALDPGNDSKLGFWTVGGQAGVNINTINYGNNDEELALYLTKRNIEKTGYFAQANASYTLPNGITSGFGLGLEKQSYKTIYNTTFQNTLIDSSLIFSHTDITVVFDSSLNQIVTHVDSIYNTMIDTTIESGLNPQQDGTSVANYLTIPLSLGYQYQKGDWILGVNVGIKINYLLNQSGTYYVNNEIIDLTKNNSIFSKTALQYNISTSFGYSLSENLYINSTFLYSPYSSNYYKPDYGLRRLNAFQIGLGVNYKF